MKRLFFLAAYTPDGIVSGTLIHQVEVLSYLGDVILCADSEIPAGELEKLKTFTLHCEAYRHCEYDFGSYKRCWLWSKQNLDITGYDSLFLVNDSVYGPLFPMSDALEVIESTSGLNGMVFNPSIHGCHVQSWFVKVPKEMFLLPEFDTFLMSVKAEGDKNLVCVRYETGLTALAKSLGIPAGAFITAGGNSIYNNVLRMFRKGLPFIKKSAFTRHKGSLGLRVKAVLKQVPPELRNEIRKDIDRVNGDGYFDWFLTSDPFKIARRYLAYLFAKVSN